MGYVNIPLFKPCTQCGDLLPNTPEYFYRRGNKLRDDCKACRQQYDRTRYENKRTEIIDRVKTYIRAHPDKHREWGRINAKRHPENSLKRGRKYETIHRERRRQQERDRYKVNINERRRIAVKSRNRRARHSQADGSYNIEDVQKQFKRQDGLCFWCSIPLFNEYHIDHVIPLSKGGTNWPHNIVVSCVHCNVTKGDRIPFAEWIPSNLLWG